MAAAVRSGTSGGTIADATSHTVTYPATISAGDKILLCIRATTNSSITPDAGEGFTSLKDEEPDASDDRTYIGWSTADGTEDGATFNVATAGNCRLSWVIVAYSDCGTPIVSANAVGTGANPDSPSLTPGMTCDLWATLAGMDGEQNTNPGEPTNYTTSPFAGNTGTAGGTSTNNRLGIGHRVTTDTTQDPGTWTFSSAAVTGWTAYTIAFPPPGAALTASPSDTLALTDAVTKATGLGRTDTVALTDAVAKARGLGRTDTLALADALDRAIVAVRALGDTLALTDAVTLARSLAIADTVALADQATPAASKTTAPADTVALTDNFSRVSTSERAVADSVALADARAHDRGLSRADAVALTDQTSTVAGKTKDLADQETLTDELTRVVTWTRSIADSVALTDEASPTTGLTATPADDVALTDNFSRVTVTLRNVADVLALTDNLNREFAALRSVADSVALTDQFARIIVANRIVVDAVALTDLLTAALGETLTIADTVTISDSIAFVLGAVAFQFPAGYEPVLASAVTGYIDPAADGRIQFPEPVGIA